MSATAERCKERNKQDPDSCLVEEHKPEALQVLHLPDEDVAVLSPPAAADNEWSRLDSQYMWVHRWSGA